MTRLQVTIGATYAYPVIIERDGLAAVPSRVAALAPGARVVVLDDARVHALYGARLVAAMRDSGMIADAVTVPEGEASKSLASAWDVIERLHARGFERRSVLVNLGGGLVTDLGGFVASVYMRGVAYVNVPTTLLAQHDSAIGGKVAVNAPWAKNFVGAFHHPRAVYCDPGVLATLGAQDLFAGVAEAVKIGVIADPALFDLLEADAARVRARDPAALEEIVRRAAAGKIALLAPDPWEVELGRALNLGHTFGHALEVELGYGRIAHGEAVAFGLAVATAVARARGVCGARDADRILGVIDAYDLPPPVPRSRLDAARRRLGETRLVRGGRLNFVLPERVGAVRVVPEIDDAEVAAAIDAIAAHPRLGRAVVRG
jgi:3-dehydroquinate synthase